MLSKQELLNVRAIGESDIIAQKRRRDESELQKFESRLRDVVANLDMRLRVAAKLQYLELKLIEVNESFLVDLDVIVWTDRTRRSTFGSAWKSVHPYHAKTVLRHPGLVALWEKIESYNLRPIFIEGAYGAPVFGVQLPDGGTYPRDDSPEEVAFRTMDRMDFFLTESGGFSFTPANTNL